MAADAVLLIVATLTDTELRSLHQKACEFGLDVLCEVHDEGELQRALEPVRKAATQVYFTSKRQEGAGPRTQHSFTRVPITLLSSDSASKHASG